MKIPTDIKPISFLKSKAAAMLKQANETHRPIIITQNGEPRAVLQDPESYESMRSAIESMKLLLTRQS
ncbi:MAG TPA: type II toxin-antitoxin system Phd/YefM family antitoxin [Gammaproteobacteria bacterium]|nr:type II toxin-antitoxin system Phd/YefM family antitoxin [Gammaproteobacteria bacterium]